ncbi:MAG: carboxypeptidase regulatory-like domain-containing protein [Myxococcales bacterium]|nr:carboxypeptidase regulatory-like domain-containing protein [Myxococcales bacterium]
MRLLAALVVGALVAGWPTGAMAQDASVSGTAAPTPKRPEELFELRLRYGIAYRRGAQTDATGPGLSFDGLTPNDPGVEGWVWPLFAGTLGFSAGVSREGFALFDRASNARVTGGGLFRAHGAATARFRLGPVRLEPVLGYSLIQVADFGDSTAPAFRAGTRHGLLLAARGLVDFGPVTIEGRFAYPVPLAANDGAGARATSTGVQAGGGVRVALFRTGTALWGLMIDASYSNDQIVGAIDASQQHIRGGLSLDLQWKEEEKTTQLAALKVSVVFDADGAPAPKARLAVQGAATSPSLDETGTGRLDDLSPGTVTVRATLDGYDDAEASTTLSAGTEAPVVLRLKKQAPKLGSLIVTVIDKETGAALAGATVVINGASATTDSKGLARFAELAPGAITVELSAPGFTAKTEAATILAGLEATVNTALVSAKRRDPATVSGFVRSARGGAPVKANLVIPQANIKAKADDSGSFVFRLVGGTYTVTISAKGFTTQTKQVTVKDGDQAIFNVDLQPK